MKAFGYISLAYILVVETSCFSYQPLAPRSEVVKTSECRIQSVAYHNSLMNLTRWAAQMYDSSAKIPFGVLSANIYHLGHFDECLRVYANLGPDNGGEVHGKYCLVTIQVGDGEPFSPPQITLYRDPFESAWDSIRPSGEPSLWKRDQLSLGFCVPASCTHEDVQNEVNYVISNNFKYNITATVDASLCQTKASIEEIQKYSFLDYFTWYLFLTALFLVVTSSIYDFQLADKPTEKNPEGILLQLLRCFSLRENVPILMKPKLFNSGFDLMTGARSFFSILVIYGHRWRWQIISPIIDSFPYEKKAREFTFLTASLIITNSFTAFSSLLTGYFFYAELEKREQEGILKPTVIIQAVVYRLLRFTPVYAVVILLNLTLLPKLSNGPMWPKTVLKEVENCKITWWTNLLYINNYYLGEKMCMYNSWYLATDLQLFLLALVALYIYKINKSTAKILVGLLMVVPSVWQGTLLYITGDYPYLTVDEQRMRRIPNDDYYLNYYIPTHFRAPAYFIGILLGLKLWEWRNIPSNLSKVKTDVYSFSLVLLHMGVIAIGHLYSLPGKWREDLIAKTLYGVLHVPVWTFLTCLILILAIRNPGGFVQRIFSMYPFILMSKLSYGAFLLHTILHNVEFGSLRSPLVPSRQSEYWLSAGDIFYTYLFSFFLNLLIEVPFSRIQKLMFVKKEESGEKDGKMTKED